MVSLEDIQKWCTSEPQSLLNSSYLVVKPTTSSALSLSQQEKTKGDVARGPGWAEIGTWGKAGIPQSFLSLQQEVHCLSCGIDLGHQSVTRVFPKDKSSGW